MLVTVLYRNAGEPDINKSIPFADVDMGSWYANAVVWAKQNGIINGINDTDEHIVTVNGAETTLRTASHIINKRMIPYTRICSKFGILIQCAGQMEIDGITIKYKKAGGIK
jgi:hypothetical protein